MDFLQLAADRFSVRSFKPDPVPEEIREKIIKAGLLAPTAKNNQPQKIIAVSSAGGLEKIKKCTASHYNAPLAFIIGYDKTLCWQRSFDGKTSGDIDASIVTTHMMLQAASIGIGSTWVMFFDPEAVKSEFEFDGNTEPVAILVMGYPADDCKPSPRHFEYKDPGEIVSYK
ncbi:MAG: nitroreductase family protein [Clostridia bacterium]|nr:nitroreductase family protein [Clostridia bacterium]